MESKILYFQDPSAITAISDYLIRCIEKNSAILCIGTDKCIIDALGPLIGTMLEKNNIHLDVYGSLESPVHAENLLYILESIKIKDYDNVIAIDACLSDKKHIGSIELRQAPINPGKGIGKILPEAGDYSIIGIVDTADKEFGYLVQNTRLDFIYRMAEVISKGIILAISTKFMVA